MDDELITLVREIDKLQNGRFFFIGDLTVNPSDTDNCVHIDEVDHIGQDWNFGRVYGDTEEAKAKAQLICLLVNNWRKIRLQILRADRASEDRDG